MASIDDVVSTLQNIARQLGLSAQSNQLAVPAATTTASPKFTGVTLGTAALTTVIASSAMRHGLILHNPGSTAIAYVFPTLTSPTPTTTSLAGTIAIAPGASVPLAPGAFSNVNAGWSGFVTSGSSQPFTVVEFF